MHNDLSWKIFVTSMWKHQWTRDKIPLTEEMKNILYEESQGIIDIAVKLYAIVQVKAITAGNDRFVAKDFHVAAAEKLGLVKPMLDALRTGDKKKIRQYGDISPISIEDYLSSYMSMAKEPVPEKSSEGKISVSEQAVLKLLELGVEPGTAKRLSGKVLASKGNSPNVADAVKEAFYLYVMEGKEREPAEADEEDFRRQGGYDAMKQKGLIDETEW